MSSQQSRCNQRGYNYMIINDYIDLDKRKHSSVRYCHKSNSQHRSCYSTQSIGTSFGTEEKVKSMSSKPNRSNNKTRLEASMSITTIKRSAYSQLSTMARATSPANETNNSIMTHLIFVLSISYLLLASLSMITNAQLTGQLYQAPSLAPSATLNNLNVASNKHLFSLTDNKQLYPSQQGQLLQQNMGANSNEFRPMLASNTQLLAPKEQLARPASDANSLQTAESNQDAYTADADVNEINDIMRNHYSGSGDNNNKKQQQSNDNNQNWNQINNNQQMTHGQKYDGSQQALPSNPAGSATNSGGYYDESDYDDDSNSPSNDGPVGRPQAAPSVPNKRGPQNINGGAITGSSTNHNHKRNYVNHNNNDYNSGTDDAYFNRRGPQKTPSMRTEASYNRHHHGRGDDSDRRESGHNQRESEGFGPGPNEAFIADKNEASGSGNEHDEDGAYDGPPGAEGSNVDDDGPPQGFGGGSAGGGPDQQSTNQLNYKEPAAQNTMHGNGGDSSQGDNEDSDIVGDGPGSDIDGIDSDFPTGYDQNSADIDERPRQPVATATNVKQGTGMRGRTSTSASASAPAPLSAVSPAAMRLQQQRQTLSSSYNPQNNPSHVGKFFIN